MLEHVAAAIHAGALAVPHREHAVVLGAREEIHLLRAPDRGRGEVLVYPGLELDVMALEVLLRSPEGLVEPAERRAAVAGDEAGRVEPGALVAQALQHHEADQRLGAGQKDPAAVEGVLVLEARLRKFDGAVHRISLDSGARLNSRLRRALALGAVPVWLRTKRLSEEFDERTGLRGQVTPMRIDRINCHVGSE